MNEFLVQIKTFRFECWYLLGLLVLLPLWAYLKGKFGRAPAIQFSSSELIKPSGKNPKTTAGKILFYIRLISLGLLILAIAKPQVEKGLSDYEAKGINIMLALDFSGTMKKRDFMMGNKRVTRAEALIEVISEFMRARENDKIGIVRYDADAYLVSPLTLDHDWLIQRLRTEKNGRGTAPGSAMLIAAEHLIPATNQTKVIIIVTDAEQVNNGPSPEEVARAIAPIGIRVHVIQVVDFKDMASLDLSWNEMAQVPKLTGGQFFQVADFQGLRNVYHQIDLLEKATFTEGKQRSYKELMGWFAFPGLFFLIIEILLAQTVLRRLP
ncbi:MAG: VWA domain-containing protein [Verrucomicrobiae bacterium]|nr:VWA domain-containing protein [Verrucomicrobiae bacterium]